MKNYLLTIYLCVLSIFTVSAQEPGDTIWTMKYGGIHTDAFQDIAITPENDLLMVGETYSFGSQDDVGNFWIFKTDSDGNEIWNKTFGEETEDDEGTSLVIASTGEYYFAGATKSYSDTQSSWLIKTDTNGDIIWEKIYLGATSSFISSIIENSEGDFVLAGYSVEAGVANVLLLKYSPEGELLSEAGFGGVSSDGAYSIKQTSDNGYIISGFTTSFGAGNRDIYLIKTDEDFNEEWTQTFGTINFEMAFDVAVTNDGGYVLGGTTGPIQNGDLWIIKTDESGNQEWEVLVEQPGEWGQVNGLLLASDGNIVATGFTEPGGNDAFMVMKIDMDGNVIWAGEYSASALQNISMAITENNEGDYYAIGQFGMGFNMDARLMKIKGDGITLNDETDIISYSFTEQTGQATIDSDAHTINIEVTQATNLTALIASFTLSENAVATIEGNVQDTDITANDFSSDLTYLITAEDGVTTQEWTVSVSLLSSIGDIELVTNLYPNPVRDVLNVETVERINKISIIDMSGKIVFEENINKNNSQIDFSTYEAGLYLVYIEFDNCVVMKKISNTK